MVADPAILSAKGWAMLKKNKNARDQLGQEQQAQATLDALPEPRTELARRLREHRRNLLHSGERPSSPRALMTDEQLQAIKERAERATQGPWRYDDGSGCIHACQDQSKVAEVCEHTTNLPRSTNGEFIAAARTDMADLLAELEWLRQRWDQVRETDKLLIEVELEHRQRSVIELEGKI
jgi:hypothetical protein